MYVQVAIELTKPYGRVLGVDLIPTQPPKGVSTIQGNFLSPDVQNNIKDFLRDPERGRLRRKNLFASSEEEATGAINAEALEEFEKGYIDLEKEGSAHAAEESGDIDSDAERMVDVVLSDMCEPWEQTTGFWKRSLTDPYLRMMNTSGNSFRDHAGSMVSLGAEISKQAGC
jgi:21S rRNA (uridine2791-2'-O)-methyltransferase